MYARHSARAASECLRRLRREGNFTGEGLGLGKVNAEPPCCGGMMEPGLGETPPDKRCIALPALRERGRSAPRGGAHWKERGQLAEDEECWTRPEGEGPAFPGDPGPGSQHLPVRPRPRAPAPPCDPQPRPCGLQMEPVPPVSLLPPPTPACLLARHFSVLPVLSLSLWAPMVCNTDADRPHA